MSEQTWWLLLLVSSCRWVSKASISNNLPYISINNSNKQLLHHVWLGMNCYLGFSLGCQSGMSSYLYIFPHTECHTASHEATDHTLLWWESCFLEQYHVFWAPWVWIGHSVSHVLILPPLSVNFNRKIPRVLCNWSFNIVFFLIKTVQDSISNSFINKIYYIIQKNIMKFFWY